MKSAEIAETFDKKNQPKVYTVAELNRDARATLETTYSQIWVEGEISNFKHHSSGHMYLSLKDDNAQISTVFFSRINQYLKFKPKDGMKVLVFGRISLYEPRGQYQFFIERMEPKGIGALQLAFIQLKEKLEKEGLFDEARKKEIPRFPQTIGIITSPTGAAIRDMLNVLNRRFSGTRVLIYPVRVQGKEAGPEIVEAIEDMNAMKKGVDVLIVGRGGGSLEDLWAFNEEIVARAVFKSRIPIISAIGHEIDWTISDMVADLRAPTPSAAAELVVQNRVEIEKQIQDSSERIKNGLLNLIEGKKQYLQSLQSSYAFRQPRLLLDQFSQRVDELARQMQNYLKAVVNEKTHAFQSIVGQLNALSPLAILERGYSLTFQSNGNIVKSAGQVKVGQEVLTKLSKGQIRSKVITVEEKEGEVMATEIQFEKALEKLEKIVQDLESGDVSLEDALKKYEEGVKLSRACQQKLKHAEKKIQILTKEQDGSLSADDFEEADEKPKKKKSSAKAKPEKSLDEDEDEVDEKDLLF